MNSTIRAIDHREMTIDQLCLSPWNARQSTPTEEDTAPLEQLILLEGLRVPIEVHRMRGSKTQHGAFAGRRRYFALKRLIGRGDLPPDHPIPVALHTGFSDAELVERSLNENLERLQMADHELWLGVAKAARLGHSVDQIAAALVQTDRLKVEKWKRLGELARPVLDAFIAGQLTIDQLKAYGATADRDLQEAIFGRLPRYASPREIRAAMKVGDALAHRQLAFVGEVTYRAAGGHYALDLFAEDPAERGRIEDEGLLQKLVDEKMATVREQVRATTRRPELRFVATPPQIDGGITDTQLGIMPTKKGDGLVVPPGDVVAHVEIDAGGEPLVSYWWASRSAKYGTKKEDVPGASFASGRAAVAVPVGRPDAAPPRDEGLSRDATFAVTALRRAILRAAMCDDADTDGEIALDYLVFVQVRALTDVPRPAGLGMRTIGGDPLTGVSNDAFALARRHIDQSPSGTILSAAAMRVRSQRFCTDDNLVRAFDDYVAADPAMKRLAAALVAGLAMERGLPGEIPLHDAVARHLRIDSDEEVRRCYWTPTAELLALYPKTQRRALAEGLVDRATYAAWERLPGEQLTTAVLTAVTRPGGRGETWVLPQLRLGHPIETPASVRKAAQ